MNFHLVPYPTVTMKTFYYDSLLCQGGGEESFRVLSTGDQGRGEGLFPEPPHRLCSAEAVLGQRAPRAAGRPARLPQPYPRRPAGRPAGLPQPYPRRVEPPPRTRRPKRKHQPRTATSRRNGPFPPRGTPGISCSLVRRRQAPPQRGGPRR